MPESVEPNGNPLRRQDLAYCLDCQDIFPDHETLRRHQNYMKQHRDREESHPLTEGSLRQSVTDNNNRRNEQQSRETVKAKGRRERSAPNHVQNTEGGGNVSNKEKNVLKKIWLPCPYCKNVFDREDEFFLHHAVKHAKNGDPPEITPIVDIISKPLVEAKSDVIQQRRKSDVLRTPRPNISYNVDQESTYDSSSDSGSTDSDDKRSDINKSSTYASKNNSDREKQPGKKYKTKSNKSINSSYGQTSKEYANSDSNTDESDEGAASTKKKNNTKHKRKQHLASCSSSGSDSASDCENSLMALMLIVLNSSKRRMMFKKLLKSRHRKILRQNRRNREETTKCKKCKIGIAKQDFYRHKKMCKSISRCKTTDSGIPSSESEDHSSNSKAEENRNKQNDKKKAKTPDRAKSAASDGDSRKRRVSQQSEAEESNSSEDDAHNKRLRLDEPETSQQNKSKKRKVTLYRCDECDGHFILKKSFLTHIKPGTHYRVKNAECPECKLKFCSKKILNDHKELHHEQLKFTLNDFTIVTNNMNFEPKKLSKPQPVCNPTVERNATPVNTNKSPNSVPVPQNLPSTSGQQNLNAQHAKQTSSQSNADRMLFKCVFCTALFLKRSAVQNHFKHTCSQRRPNKFMSNCEYCNLKFSRKSLKEHKNIHHKKMKLGTKDFVIITVGKPKRDGRMKTMVPTAPQESEMDVQSSTDCKGSCVVKLTKNNGNAWSVASSSKCNDDQAKSDSTELTATDTTIVTTTFADTRAEAVSQTTDCAETARNIDDNNSTPIQINTETPSVSGPDKEKVDENVEKPTNFNCDRILNRGENDECFKNKLHNMTANNMVDVPFLPDSMLDVHEEYTNVYNDSLIKEENLISEHIAKSDSQNNNNDQVLNSNTKPDNKQDDTDINTEELTLGINDLHANTGNQSRVVLPFNNIFSAKFKFEIDDEAASNADSIDTVILKYEDDPVENTIAPETDSENETENPQIPHDTCETVNADLKADINEKSETNRDRTQRQSNTVDDEITQEIIKKKQNTQNDQSAETKREIKEKPNSNDHQGLPRPETAKVHTIQKTVQDNVSEGLSTSVKTTGESDSQKDDLNTCATQLLEDVYDSITFFIEEIANETLDPNNKYFESDKSKENNIYESVDLTDDTTDDDPRNISPDDVFEVPDNDVIAISDSDGENTETGSIRFQNLQEFIGRLQKKSASMV